MSPQARVRVRALAVLAAVLVAVAVYGTVVDSPVTWFYVPITAVLAGLVALIDRSARFSPAVLAALVAIAVGNLAGGVLLVGGEPLYLLELVGPVRYDKVFHTVSTGVAAWACWDALTTWAGTSSSAGGLAAAAFLMACGTGALVEVVEFVGTSVFTNTNVGDYGDNMLDLVANAGGAAVVALVLWRLPVDVVETDRARGENPTANQSPSRPEA